MNTSPMYPPGERSAPVKGGGTVPECLRCRELEKALRRFMRMAVGDIDPRRKHSCMEQARAALKGRD